MLSATAAFNGPPYLMVLDRTPIHSVIPNAYTTYYYIVYINFDLNKSTFLYKHLEVRRRKIKILYDDYDDDTILPFGFSRRNGILRFGRGEEIGNGQRARDM